MDKIVLKTKLRKDVGTIKSKKLRTNNAIPAVVYKHGQKTQNVQVAETELIHALHTSAGENAIITLQFQSEEKGAPRGSKTVIIKEIQYHPIADNILHIDFQEISLTEKIKVDVPIILKGEAVGVKTDGGVLEHIIKELEVECLPTQIPEKIDINVEEMKIGDMVHVKELNIPAELKILTDPEAAVVTVAPPQAEEEVTPEAEAVEGEAQEPEVISEKKAEERETEAAAEVVEKGEKAKEDKKEGKEKEPKKGA